MEKAIEIGKTSTKGSFHLFIGIATSTIIMAIGTIILARLMTQEEYGLYSIALIPSYTATLFTSWGINAAITKYTASLKAQNKTEKTHQIIRAGLIFETLTGTTLTIAFIILSNFIATAIFNRPETTFPVALASLTILSTTLLQAAKSAFIGYERMELNSLTLIAQAAAKTILSPILVLLGYSFLGAVIGYTTSTIAAAAIALAILYTLIIRKLKIHQNPQKPSLIKTLKQMLHYGVPLSISAIISGFLIQFYSFLMAIYCTDAAIGNYQVATQFATLLTFITIPISTVLFPAFSKINPQKEHQLLQTLFPASIKYTAILLIPATMAVMALSKPMITTLFGEKWTAAPFYLTLYVITNLFAIFGNISLGSILAGLGETKTQMKLTLITLTFGIPLSLTLIPTLKITGLIATTITAGIPSIAIGLTWMWKKYKTKPDFKSSAKILISSTLAALITHLSTTLINQPPWIELAIGGTIFLATYLTTAPIIGAIKQDEIKNLKTLFSNLGIISKIMNIPLNLAQKVSQTFYSNKET